MAFRQVFVTVGTTKFDEFVSTITEKEVLKVLRKRGCERLVIQIGRGDVVPDNCSLSESSPQVVWYRYKDDIGADMSSADLVLSHAGSGTCLEALDAGKRLLVVINEDLMGNHQTELAEKLAEEQYLHYTTCTSLRKTLETVDFSATKPYPKSDPTVFTRFLDRFMGFSQD